MRYVIRRAVLDSCTEVPITADDFGSLVQARGILTAALAIEEKYALLVANYLDLEKRLLEIAAVNSVSFNFSYPSIFDSRTSLNICMVNLLTGARMYLDHILQDVADCVLQEDEGAKMVKARCSKEYGEHLEYRFMEALRNHVQHRGMAVHGVTMPSQWGTYEGDEVLEYSVTLYALRKVLAQDKKFKRSVLADLPERIDLLSAARRYVESLSGINEFVRETIAEPVTEARAAIERARHGFAAVTDESLIGLEAAKFDGPQRTASVALLLDWDDVRTDLRKRNRKLVNLGKRMISSRVHHARS